MLVALGASRGGGDGAHGLRAPAPVPATSVGGAPFAAPRPTVRRRSGLRAGGAACLKQARWQRLGVRNGRSRPGGGDIDHLVRSPNGLGFAIETKTLTFRQEHLRRTEATARWAARRRRRYPRGVVPVLCVVRARRVEWRCGDVVVVSLDRLLAVLERLAMSAGHRGVSRERRRSRKRQVRGGGTVGLSPRRSAVPGGHDG